MSSDDASYYGWLWKMGKPLEGIRVLECGVWHAGPGAGAILSDLGATVIKIESPGGDPERRYGSFGPMALGTTAKDNWNLLFEISNRNKQGICLDVGTEQGGEVLRRLVKDADIFITNLRSSTTQKFGIDFESLKKVNPQIVHVTVSGFGAKGPFADVGGFDPMGQAISGMMFLGGQDEPNVMQVIILDQLTAITASHAALTGLVARQTTGEAQGAHVSLYGSALWLMHANVMQSSVRGVEIETSWDRTRNPFSRTTFECADGKWIMGTNHPEEKYWEAFCEAVGTPELAADPRYDTKEKRATVNPELIRRFDEVFKTKDRREWLEILHAHRLLFAPVNRTTDTLTDEQALVNGYLVDFDHPYLGRVRIPGYPVNFGSQEVGPEAAAPDLGEHTELVLQGAGYSQDEIDELRAAKVIL